MLVLRVPTSLLTHHTPVGDRSRPIAAFRRRLLLTRISCSSSSSRPSSPSGDGILSRLDYDASRELLGFDLEPHPQNLTSSANTKSWFGPNGQYVKELPCPNCRARGYTPCSKCGIERSIIDCPECHGKGLKTCQQCSGDRVIWEEFVDEKPWEKAHSSSPLKVKDDDEVDNLEITVDVKKRSTRVYRSLSPEVSMKISQSLKILNAKTGLFSKKMKILHGDPKLHAQRVAAIKKSKGTKEARRKASEMMKAYFSNTDNRLKRSIAMKGVKFHCSHCGEEGHRSFYCPSLKGDARWIKYRCRSCGKLGHNSRRCGKKTEAKVVPRRGGGRRCGICSQAGHNRRNCPQLVAVESDDSEGSFEAKP